MLGDFGRGKTSFLRQLARTLPAELPGLLPVLVELRGLEKAPTLDELLSQYLVRQGVEDINPAKLRYMIHSGRVGLLFDGFDELELRVGYDNAADYLRVLLDSVTGRAKVVLTSRTQHFRSTEQVTTALGERVSTLTASRVVVLEDFSEEQVLQFLTNLFGDEARARTRFDLLGAFGNLLELARNPRMLAFVAELDEERLRAVQSEEGQVSAAGLYREIIDFWLAGEAERQRHRRGLPSLDESERLSACTALALRLWTSKDLTIALNDLSAEVSATLTGLAERGYSEEQATHSIGSGSLLVRTEDGAFAFVHQSIMEWLVATLRPRDLGNPRAAQILTTPTDVQADGRLLHPPGRSSRRPAAGPPRRSPIRRPPRPPSRTHWPSGTGGQSARTIRRDPARTAEPGRSGPARPGPDWPRPARGRPPRRKPSRHAPAGHRSFRRRPA